MKEELGWKPTPGCVIHFINFEWSNLMLTSIYPRTNDISWTVCSQPRDRIKGAVTTCRRNAKKLIRLTMIDNTLNLHWTNVLDYYHYIPFFFRGEIATTTQRSFGWRSARLVWLATRRSWEKRNPTHVWEFLLNLSILVQLVHHCRISLVQSFGVFNLGWWNYGRWCWFAWRVRQPRGTSWYGRGWTWQGGAIFL